MPDHHKERRPYIGGILYVITVYAIDSTFIMVYT